MDKLNIVSPWVNYVKELEKLFELDPEVSVYYDEGKNEVKLYVDSTEKAEALMMILPKVKEFGAVKLFITIIPANETMNKADIFRAAFEGNPVFSDAVTIDVGSSNPFTYVSFKPMIAQYWCDNLGDPHGVKSTLFEDISRDLFDIGGVYYVTDLIEKEE